MELNLEEQKQRFLELCHATIHRDDLEDLLSWLQKFHFGGHGSKSVFQVQYFTVKVRKNDDLSKLRRDMYVQST